MIKDGEKHIFNDYDTFLNMKFQTTQVRVISYDLLQKIPSGADMPPVATPKNVKDQMNLVDLTSRSHGHPRTHNRRETAAIESVSGKSIDKPLNQSKLNSHKRHHHHHKHGLNNGNIGGHAHTVNSLTLSSPELLPIVAQLENISKTIENITMDCYRDDYAGTRDEFLKDRWKSVISDLPVMVYPLCINTFQLGNTLGYYFNDVACAQLSGVHYIGVHKYFQIQDPSALSTPTKYQHTFLEALPKLIPHRNAVDIQKAKENVRNICQCVRYCWENAAAPWLKVVETISQYMLYAIDSYIDVADIDQGTVLSNITDLIYYPTKSDNKDTLTVSDTLATTNLHPYLPLIPDVTIQYRCGDNIGFGKTRYGLLPFPAITSRIYPTAKHIYIIADSPLRSAGHPYNSRCGIILEALFDILKSKFPNSVVIIKRGGDLFLDVARLAYSNITICSASTFCLWPALANRGSVHFPFTPLIAGGWTNKSLPDFGPNFHWIREVEILKEFKQFKPWNLIIDYLKNTVYTLD